MLDRESIISHLAKRLQTHDCILAATIGGSDASGRADARSDVDLFMIVRPGSVEPTIAAFEAVLAELSPTRISWRLPMPTWHGFHQAFYQLERAAEWTMVDWLIIETNHPSWRTWLEVERHGRHRVLFDKDGLVGEQHMDRAALKQVLDRRVAELRLKFPLFRHLPVKLVDRGLPVDAIHFYHALVVRPLVDMLRIVHCPERHDFGLRYLRDDLPAAAYEAVSSLCYPRSVSEIPEMVRRATTLFDDVLRGWDASSSATR